MFKIDMVQEMISELAVNDYLIREDGEIFKVIKKRFDTSLSDHIVVLCNVNTLENVFPISLLDFSYYKKYEKIKTENDKIFDEGYDAFMKSKNKTEFYSWLCPYSFSSSSYEKNVIWWNGAGKAKSDWIKLSMI